MESLLASYGESDDEEITEVQAGPGAAQTVAGSSVRSSWQSWLPPPVVGDGSRPRIGKALPAARNLYETPAGGIDFAGREEIGVQEKVVPSAVGNGVSDAPAGREGGGIGGGWLSMLPPPKKGTVSQKRTVEFKPPVNPALMYQDDEDEEARPAKKRVVSAAGGGKIGLTAILPPPKHTLGVGTALGGGAGAGGRRTIMETQGRVSAESESAEAASVEADAATPQTCRDVPHEGASLQQEFAQDQYTASVYQDQGTADYSWQDQPNDVQYDTASYGPPSGEGSGQVLPVTADDALARVLQAERRRGRPPTVIEVKQADLTKGKIREDQVSSTGIAFGPAYKPAAATKDKPSKLHRRKHQIGSLYYDMRQKEMELNDRRARGQLTKAETQAKYGW